MRYIFEYNQAHRPSIIVIDSNYGFSDAKRKAEHLVRKPVWCMSPMVHIPKKEVVKP